MGDFSKSPGTIKLLMPLFVHAKNISHCSFPVSLCPGAAPAMLLPILLACLAGCALLGAAFMGLWLQQRHRAKPSRCAQLGDFQGL